MKCDPIKDPNTKNIALYAKTIWIPKKHLSLSLIHFVTALWK